MPPHRKAFNVDPLQINFIRFIKNVQFWANKYCFNTSIIDSNSKICVLYNNETNEDQNLNVVNASLRLKRRAGVFFCQARPWRIKATKHENHFVITAIRKSRS